MLARRTALIIFAITSAALLCGGYYWWHFRSGTNDSFGRTNAPDFSLPDAAGVEHSLVGTQGMVRILNVWASWSPLSRDELPMLTALVEAHENVVLLALSRDTNPADGRVFIKELSLADSDTVHFVYDASDEYFTLIDGYNMPETLVLDANGGVVLHVHGPITQDILEAALIEAQKTHE